MNNLSAVSNSYFSSGGPFMYLLVMTSIVSVAIIIFKIMTLGKKRIVPRTLAHEIDRFEEHLNEGTAPKIEREFRNKNSALARLATVAMDNAGKTQSEIQESVQSSAREEVVKMNAAMSALEVVINIAPLLGLLGTASGLVIVFKDLGSGTSDPAVMAQGIARALNTTIVGLAITVPSVIAHSSFSRSIETMAVRLEVLMGKMVSALHQYQIKD